MNTEWQPIEDEEERLRHLGWGPDFNIMSDGRTNCAICGNNFLTTSRSRRCPECTDAARMRGVIDNLNDEVERLRAEAKANLDLAERHMDEKHKLRAVLTWIDLQRYTDRGTINPDNAFEKAGELNKRIIEIMDRATAVLKEQT